MDFVQIKNEFLSNLKAYLLAFGGIGAFLISLIFEKSRNFLFNLPGLVIRYYRKKFPKSYLCDVTILHHRKFYGTYYKWEFDNHEYLLDERFLRDLKGVPTKVLKRDTSDVLRSTQGSVEGSTIDLGPKISLEEEKGKLQFSNEELIETLDKFCLYEKETLYLTKTLYLAIREKLKGRNLVLDVKVHDNEFEKIPFYNLTERDFQCPNDKICIKYERQSNS